MITYVSGDHKTQVDYVLFRSSLRKLLKDGKVIPNEECMPQHSLFICIFKISIPPSTSINSQLGYVLGSSGTLPWRQISRLSLKRNVGREPG